MEHVSIEDVERWITPATVMRPLSRGLGSEHVNINYYELEPGDTFGFGYHRHHDQEEVFYLMAGTARFETEDGDVSVSAGELVRFAPGEWQLGRNNGDEIVRALALGAPADAEETEILIECPDCSERTHANVERASDGSDALVTICEECGSETGRYSEDTHP
jgi:uncharacterized cupin superfamily protein